MVSPLFLEERLCADEASIVFCGSGGFLFCHHLSSVLLQRGEWEVHGGCWLLAADLRAQRGLDPGFVDALKLFSGQAHHQAFHIDFVDTSPPRRIDIVDAAPPRRVDVVDTATCSRIGTLDVGGRCFSL